MTVLRAVQQPTFKVQFRKISKFVAAIDVVLTDDPTISLLNKNPPAAGRSRPKRQVYQ
jgi:hypothetical protein